MTNHVHLLVTPTGSGQVSRMMQALGRRYVSYINRNYHRTGTLWEGRYKACLVANDIHLMRCHRYIELNPVRARMVTVPDAYPWSSYHYYARDRHGSILQPYPLWLSLALNHPARQEAWRRFVLEAIDPVETDAIRLYLQRQHAYGPAHFRSAIEAQLGRRAGPATIGRPRKKAVQAAADAESAT